MKSPWAIPNDPRLYANPDAFDEARELERDERSIEQPGDAERERARAGIAGDSVSDDPSAV